MQGLKGMSVNEIKTGGIAASIKDVTAEGRKSTSAVGCMEGASVHQDNKSPDLKCYKQGSVVTSKKNSFVEGKGGKLITHKISGAINHEKHDRAAVGLQGFTVQHGNQNNCAL